MPREATGDGVVFIGPVAGQRGTVRTPAGPVFWGLPSAKLTTMLRRGMVED